MSICLSRLRDTRIEEDSDNSTSYKYLLVRNVFREYIRGNMEHRAVIGFAASLVEEYFREYIRGNLNGDFGGAIATMMVLIVEDGKLPWSYSVNRFL